MIELLRRLFSHLAWADGRALEALRAAQGEHARAQELLAHVAGSEGVWLARIEGRPPEVAVWPALSLDECEQLGRRVRAGYDALLARLDEAALARPVHYRNSAGLEFDTPVVDILLHVALHGAYHRGQVALLLRSAGAAPLPSDYIAWARGVPAATRSDR